MRCGPRAGGAEAASRLAPASCKRHNASAQRSASRAYSAETPQVSTCKRHAHWRVGSIRRSRSAWCCSHTVAIPRPATAAVKTSRSNIGGRQSDVTGARPSDIYGPMKGCDSLHCGPPNCCHAHWWNRDTWHQAGTWVAVYTCKTGSERRSTRCRRATWLNEGFFLVRGGSAPLLWSWP